jgi:hypothetical protein
VTRQETPVGKAAQQKFSAYAPKLDRHSGLPCLLEALIFCECHQPFPFSDETVHELGDRVLCILD